MSRSGGAVVRGFALAWRWGRHLPGPVVRAATTVAADITWLRHGAGVRRLEANLRRVRPDLAPDELRRLSRAGMRSYLRYYGEAFTLPGSSPQQIAARVRVVGRENVQPHLDAGRQVVMALGHLGNWEIGGAYVAARGLPIDVVARRMGNPLFDAYLTRTRSRLGMAVVPDQDAVRRTPRALAQGRVVAFVADQAGLTLSSSYIPFFGRPAKTPRGPAVFALRLGVPLLFGVAVRQPAGTYRITFEEIPVRDTGDREGDVDRVLEAYTRTLERWVRLVPEQYFWHHRRWKRQPADTPPELRDPT